MMILDFMVSMEESDDNEFLAHGTGPSRKLWINVERNSKIKIINMGGLCLLE